MLCVKKSSDAVIPVKAGPDEVGYDIVLTRLVKWIDDYTVMYDTDIIIKGPPGFYFEIVPRSSIVKTGWFLANSVGVIDPTYRDTVKVVLKRTTMYQKEIALPSKICQLILRPCHNTLSFEETDSLEETYRKGGFGSTNNK